MFEGQLTDRLQQYAPQLGDRNLRHHLDCMRLFELDSGQLVPPATLQRLVDGDPVQPGERCRVPAEAA